MQTIAKAMKEAIEAMHFNLEVQVVAMTIADVLKLDKIRREVEDTTDRL